MRVIIIGIAVVLGCGGDKHAETPAAPVKAAPTGSDSSGTGTNSGHTTGVCFPLGAERELNAFLADDTTATLCTSGLGEADKQIVCAAVDLASGAWKRIAAPPP